MKTRAGSTYQIAGQGYIDSHALYRLTELHKVVPHADGWTILTSAGAIQCERVDGPALPRQRGRLYALTAEGGATLRAARTVWMERGVIAAAGEFATWPGAKTGCGCGKTCGCAPCRQRHGHGAEDHHDPH